MLDFKFDKIKWLEDSEGFWVSVRVHKDGFQKRDAELVKAIKKFAGEFKEKIHEATFKIFRERRSVDANAYAWLLIGRIAEKLTAEKGAAYTKDDIYLIMIERYGQGDIVKIPKSGVEKFKKAFKYCREHETMRDENAVYYRFWVGSSKYNTEEMTYFINGIVAECQEMGIETRLQSDIDSMLEQWDSA